MDATASHFAPESSCHAAKHRAPEGSSSAHHAWFFVFHQAAVRKRRRKHPRALLQRNEKRQPRNRVLSDGRYVLALPLATQAAVTPDVREPSNFLQAHSVAHRGWSCREKPFQPVRQQTRQNSRKRQMTSFIAVRRAWDTVSFQTAPSCEGGPLLKLAVLSLSRRREGEV
jgi:hypothetical protein